MMVKHTKCGQPVTVAVLQHDAAIYVWCNTCNDIVENGELDIPTDVNAAPLCLDIERDRSLINLDYIDDHISPLGHAMSEAWQRIEQRGDK